jgi:hypothetical protein
LEKKWVKNGSKSLKLKKFACTGLYFERLANRGSYEVRPANIGLYFEISPSYAFALQAADLALIEQDRRDALACRAAHYQAAASARIAAYDARFARELAAVPEDQWARDGDYFERPLDLTTSSSSSRPLFRVYFKGMASSEAVGARDRDPGLAVLAVAVCGPQGNVVLRTHKPVEGVFVGDGEMLEAMALLEGLRAALELDIRSVKVITDHEILHNHVCHRSLVAPE